MKLVSSDLQAMAVAPSGYPQDELPELAFAGRSNVGKSSLINTVINRTNLARTSGKPGKTRTVNFYLINEQFRFVDLPGYGYAQVSKSERERWKSIIETYLKTRENLRAIVLVVDIRHKPSVQDIEMFRWIKLYGHKPIVVATKADKIAKGQWQKYLKVIRLALEMGESDDLIPFSSSKKLNLNEVRETFSKELDI